MDELTAAPPYKSLPKGKANLVIPTSFLALMTGVKLAKQDNTGMVKLVYMDDTEEAAKLNYDIAKEKNFFKIVGDLQEKAQLNNK